LISFISTKTQINQTSEAFMKNNIAFRSILLGALWAACDGGSDVTDSTASTNQQETTFGASAELQATPTVLPTESTPIARVETLLDIDNFENGTMTWHDNWWPTTGPRYVQIGIETNPANVVAGSTKSARFRIDEPTNAIFISDKWTFTTNHRYRFRVNIKADAATTVDLMLRGGGATYFRQYATRHVNVTTAWQQVIFEGIPGEADTQLAFIPGKGVTVYLDDIWMEEITQDELKPVNTTSPIPDTLFGLHISKLGEQGDNWPKAWPKIGQKVVRLHDTGTHWCDLEKADNQWDYSRLDMFVSLTKGNGPAGTAENFPQYGGLEKPADPGAEILYEMGMTPTWASPNKTRQTAYCNYGGTFPPSDLAETGSNSWRDYVTRIGTRYKGRIKYWEIWNEWDIGSGDSDLGGNIGINYEGDVAKMVLMTKIAHDVLKAIDPNNVIVAPSVTVGGLPQLEAFFQAGGARYVDVIAYHAGGGDTAPESTYVPVANVRQIMAANQVDLPLWDTEASQGCDPRVTLNCNQNGNTPAANLTTTELGWPMRHLLTLWARGVNNFNYYTNEGAAMPGALVYGKYEPVSATNCAAYDPAFRDYNPNCQTPLGRAYTKTVGFLKGAMLTDAYETAGKNGRVFVFKLNVGGNLRVVLWSTGADELVAFPNDDGGWTDLKYVNTLTGGRTPIGWRIYAGVKRVVFPVNVGGAPVVLTVD
jgi:hypothetical protein